MMDDPPIEDWEWLDEYEEWGYALGVLCRECFTTADRSGCKTCVGTGKTPMPLSEVWGNLE